LADRTLVHGTIYGSVISPTLDRANGVVSGVPRDGITIIARKNGALAAKTRTGSDGRYEFFHLPPDEYRIEAEGLGGAATLRVAAGECKALSFTN